LGEAVSGSEAAFARRMNRTAKALGMSRTTFKNAHGLTEAGHLSTARDMTTLGRRLFFDYPAYYNLFSRRTTDAGLRKVSNTNRKFLGNYPGADGIKTGYTRAAGFNLVASAQRGGEHIITTVFGGVSSASRNAKVGFRRSPTRATIIKTTPPVYASAAQAQPGAAGKTLRLVRAVSTSMYPVARPLPQVPAISDELLLAMAEGIEKTIADLQSAVPDSGTDEVQLASLGSVVLPQELEAPVVVTRISTSGGRLWGINLGSFNTRHEAEGVLLKTALRELGTLDEALRKVVKSRRGFEANFVGMSQELAALACRRLDARDVQCTALGPS